MALDIFHKSKVRIRSFLGSFLFLMGMGLTPLQPQEPQSLPNFDPGWEEIKSVLIGVRFQDETLKFLENNLETKIQKKVLFFLQGQISKNVEIKFIKDGETPSICKDQIKGEATLLEAEDSGELFLTIQIRTHPFTGFVTLDPCFFGKGPVKLNFPEDWSNIDPNPNIRQGSCNEEWVNSFSDFVFCRIKPDLTLLAYEINQKGEGEMKD